MRLVTGNRFKGDSFTEISIQVTMNGFSFIVTSDNGVESKVIVKKNVAGHDIEATLAQFNVNVHSVKVVWASRDVELVPAEVFDANNDNFTRGGLVNDDLNYGIVARWNLSGVMEEALVQIENVFEKVYHVHFLQTIIDQKNTINLVEVEKVLFLTVAGNSGLESYIVTQIESAADALYYLNKLVKQGRNYKYRLVSGNREFIATIEKYINVNGVLSTNPVLLLCE